MGILRLQLPLRLSKISSILYFRKFLFWDFYGVTCIDTALPWQISPRASFHCLPGFIFPVLPSSPVHTQLEASLHNTHTVQRFTTVSLCVQILFLMHYFLEHWNNPILILVKDHMLSVHSFVMGLFDIPDHWYVIWFSMRYVHLPYLFKLHLCFHCCMLCIIT